MEPIPSPLPTPNTGYPYAPLPVRHDVGNADLEDGTRAVVVVLSTPQGPQAYFFNPDHARRLAADLVRQADHVASGIIVASGPLGPLPGSNGQN